MTCWQMKVDPSGLRISGASTFVATDPAGSEVYGGTSGLIGTRVTVLEPGMPVTVPAVGLAA